MGFRRKFYGQPVARLIVSVPVEIVEEVDELIGQHPRTLATVWRNTSCQTQPKQIVRLAVWRSWNGTS